MYKFIVVTSAVVLCCAVVAPASAQVGICDDDIYAEVDGSRVSLFHDGSEYNCCPDHFEYHVDLGAELILVTENEILLEPCDCICCFDLSADITNVPAGTYTLIFRWLDYGLYEWLEWPLEITVPEVGQGGLALIGPVAQSDCYWDTTGIFEPPPPEEPRGQPELGRVTGSWTQIKALYH